MPEQTCAGRPREAVDDFSRARELNPVSSLLLAQMGLGLACAGDSIQADSTFQRALAIDSLPSTFLFRGLVEGLLGNTAEAVADLERYVGPGTALSDRWLGAAYASEGRAAEARQIIRNREGQGLLSPGIWMALGEIDRGLEEFQLSFEQTPAHPRCYQWWYGDYRDDPRVRDIVEDAFPPR